MVFWAYIMQMELLEIAPYPNTNTTQVATRVVTKKKKAIHNKTIKKIKKKKNKYIIFVFVLMPGLLCLQVCYSGTFVMMTGYLC